MAFTTTVGAGGTSLIGTSGVDTTAFDPGTLLTSIYIGAQGDDDVVNFQTSSANSANVNMGTGDDIVNVAAGLRNSFVRLDDGADTITTAGTLQSTTISGLNGIDTINVGGTMTSALVNGNNDDDVMTVTATIQSDSFFVGGQGGDTINVGTGVTQATLTSGRINGQDGADTITITSLAAMSGSGATINGGQGSDFLNGAANAAAMVLSGDLGNDTVTGAGGNDTLFGGDGTDQITGGLANDQMSGGTGSDTFFANVAAPSSTNATVQAAAGGTWAANDTITFGGGADVITDFEGGTGGDVFRSTGATALNYAVGGAPVAAFGTANGIGTVTAAASVYALSGNYNRTSGVFTVTANGAGADTALIVSTATAATFAAVNGSDASAILVGTNYNTLTAANFAA